MLTTPVEGDGYQHIAGASEFPRSMASLTAAEDDPSDDGLGSETANFRVISSHEI